MRRRAVCNDRFAITAGSFTSPKSRTLDPGSLTPTAGSVGNQLVPPRAAANPALLRRMTFALPAGEPKAA
jgi:hypothetical protein